MDHDSHSGTEMYYSDSSVRISSKHSSENEQFVMEVDTMRRQSTPPPYPDQPSNSYAQNPIYGNAPQLPTVVSREEPLPSSSSTTPVRPRSHTSAVSKPNLSPHHLRTLSTSGSTPSSPSAAQLNISMPDLRNGFQPQSPRGEPNVVFPFIPVSQLPLPGGWELGYTKKGRPYFIDHFNQRTTFEDPRFPPGYVPTVVLSSTPVYANTPSTHNTNNANNNNVPPPLTNSSSSSSIYGNVDAPSVIQPTAERPKSPTAPVYGNSYSSYNNGSLRPSASGEKPPIVRVTSKEGPSPASNRLSMSLSQEALASSTASLANTLTASGSAAALSHSGSVEGSVDSNESYPVPSSIPLATASGVPASTKIALDPKFNSRKKYKDVILGQIQSTKEELDRTHKQNVSQASKFKDQKEKAAILKHQTDLQHMEKQYAQQMKQKVKEIELTQNSEKKKCKARWKEEQKQDEDKASSLPWQNKEVVQKQLANQFKEKQQQLDHFHVLQHLELTQQLIRQQQKQLFEEKVKQAVEDSDFLIEFSINSLKEERDHHRKVNEISLKILQRIHALNRTEVMEEHRKQADQLADKIKEEHKAKTKEFKAQEKERKKEQEKALKKELSQNKSANKKELQAAYDAENEKLYHKHLQVLEKKKEEEEVSLHQKQMKLQEELRQSQYALEQQQARELFEKDQKLLIEHAEKVQRDVQNVFKNCKKYFSEKDNLIPVLNQHVTMLFSKLDEQLLQHQNLIKEQYDKLVSLYDKESEKDRQASIKLERKSMRDKRSTVRSGVTESSGIEDKMSFLQQVHVKNQKIVRQKAWYQRQEMYLLCGRNHAEKGVLVNKRNLLASKHREESDLVEFVGAQLKEMTNHFFHIAYNSWKSFLEERASLTENYQPYIDSPIAVPPDTNLALLESQHDERINKFDAKLEQSRSTVRKQLQDEMQEFETKYERTMQTHNLQEEKLKAEHDNDLRQLEGKFEKQIEEIQQEYGIFPQPRSMERSASSNRMTNRAEFKVSEPRQVMSSPEVGEPPSDLKKVVNEKDEEIVQLRKQLTELQKKYTMKEMSGQFASVRHTVFDIREDLARHKDDLAVPVEEHESRSRSATTDSENSPVHSETPTPLRAVALFAFSQRKDDQLSFAKGDIITILKQRKSGWWKGELNGRTGKFPSNYCKVLDDRSRSASVVSVETKYSEPGSHPPSLPSQSHHHNSKEARFVRALYTYTKKKANQLSFAKGDIIKVLEEKTSGWWIGELNGQSGKFPSNFCEVITDKEEIKNAIAASDKRGPESDHDKETESSNEKSQPKEDTGSMRRALDVLKSLEVYEDSNENSDLSNLKNEFDVANVTLTENRNHDLHSETDTDTEQLNLKLNMATANQKLPALSETDKANALLELERLLVDSEDEEEEEEKVAAPAVVAPPKPAVKQHTATRALVSDSEDDDQSSEVFFRKQMGLQSHSQAKAHAGSMRESDYLNKIKMLLEQGGSSEEE